MATSNAATPTTPTVTVLAPVDAAAERPHTPAGPPGAAAMTDDRLAARARRALALVDRYRQLEAAVAACAVTLRPAVDAYLALLGADASHTSNNGGTAAAIRRAQAAAQLRTRLDVWSALLGRDIPGFLGTYRQPGLRGPRALCERALGVVALARIRAQTAAALPYGQALIDDLESARIELQHAGADAVRAAAGDPPQLASVLERELSTFAAVLVALLGRDHVDAQRALECTARRPARR